MRDFIKLRNLAINFGPQHPAAHGVLRLIIHLDGERIKRVDPHIGLLHRGTEKLLEYKNYIQGLPYFDRLDYVSMMAQEMCYSKIIENMLNVKVTGRTEIIRTIFLEITRILNHILAVTTHALDVGALTPFLWGFEEREKLMEFYERVSGARLHANYIRPGGLLEDLPLGLSDDIYHFVKQMYKKLDEIAVLLINNRIWGERLCYVGNLKYKTILDYGFTGVMARGSGINFDIRKSYNNLLFYNKMKFCVPVGKDGDCYDRFLIRFEEMYQSLSIIRQGLELLSEVEKTTRQSNFGFIQPDRADAKNSMEDLILHFKNVSEGFYLKENSSYYGIEAPKGEFGISLISNYKNRPFRCKIRAPGYYHLQGLNGFILNSFLADLVTTIGTLDLVFGEIDR